MIAHLVKPGQKRRLLDHENETALFQKLIINYVGDRKLELWVAWEDGEIDFIFPEQPDLLFEESLQQIWRNWESQTDPLTAWIEEFLLKYNEVLRANADLSSWQERSIEVLDQKYNRNANYHIEVKVDYKC